MLYFTHYMFKYIFILTVVFFGCKSDITTDHLLYNSKVEYFKSPNSVQELVKKHEGNVLYVDIWASWCGPCMREISPAKSLKAKFHKDDSIKFIYINISDSENRWRATVEAKKIKGLNTHANEQLVLSLERDYGLKDIPRYMIFDKKGKLVNGNALRPSDREVFKILRDLIDS